MYAGTVPDQLVSLVHGTSLRQWSPHAILRGLMRVRPPHRVAVRCVAHLRQIKIRIDLYQAIVDDSAPVLFATCACAFVISTKQVGRTRADVVPFARSTIDVFVLIQDVGTLLVSHVPRVKHVSRRLCICERNGSGNDEEADTKHIEVQFLTLSLFNLFPAL